MPGNGIRRIDTALIVTGISCMTPEIPDIAWPTAHFHDLHPLHPPIAVARVRCGLRWKSASCGLMHCTNAPPRWPRRHARASAF